MSYVGQITTDVCYPGCPVSICEGPQGRYQIPNQDCGEGGGGGIPGPMGGEPAAGCAPGYQEFQGTCVPTQPGLAPTSVPSAGREVKAGFPWGGVDLHFLPSSWIEWLTKYAWWIAGGAVGLYVLSGSGRRR